MPITGLPATIAAIYNTDAGQSIASGTTSIVDFEDKVQDTHGAVTTGAAWKFTAPSGGFYQVSACILFAATNTWADVEAGQISLYVNGVAVSYLDFQDHHGSASSINLRLGGSTLVYLNAGDYLDVRIYQASGAALALYEHSGYNRISIVKV